MLSKFLNKVGKVVFVFLLIIVLMIASLIVEFNSIDLVYAIIVLVYLIKYVRLKLS